MAVCHIALGGNLGDVTATFSQVFEQLAHRGQATLRKLSRCYLTAPIGDAAPQPFINAAAELQTELTPEELLQALHEVEAQLGRKRERHWGPRTLDLDLIFYEDVVLRTPQLTLPHPRLWQRRFVLDPLAEIAPRKRHPVIGQTMAALKKRLLFRPLTILMAGELGFAVIEREGWGHKLFYQVEFRDYFTATKKQQLTKTVLWWGAPDSVADRSGIRTPLTKESSFESVLSADRSATLSDSPATPYGDPGIAAPFLIDLRTEASPESAARFALESLLDEPQPL